MNAYKTYVEVDPSGRVVLEHLPFRAGARVEVLVVDQSPEAGEVESWHALFRHIRSLPQSRSITDEDITKEIDDYRSGR
ncbi:hypothetical protein [Candidatus Thiosymbion oneisti]|uniref:hypothetical protein n=1 Tax=Candidatus Thiosymbion oneisti TaxID=589554 RepID=UPI000B7FA269|nr:hypothetical protein [Candidatus Thiosymbion oneisti]